MHSTQQNEIFFFCLYNIHKKYDFFLGFVKLLEF